LGIGLATSGEVESGELRLSEEERDRLYSGQLYTIRHRIGRTVGGAHVDEGERLVGWVREAMPGVGEREHERLRAAVEADRPPALLLHVHILEVSGASKLAHCFGTRLECRRHD
jgi:hypothetical protein